MPVVTNTSARYCRAFTTRSLFQQASRLLYTPVSKRVRELPSGEAELIQSCSQFRTLEEHAAAWGNKAGDSSSQLIQKLRRYAESGLLVADAQLISQCKLATPPENSPPAITAVGATTRNRPQLLQRGLASFLANARNRGRQHEVVIVDDGVTAEEQAATRQALETVAREGGAEIRYAGRQQRQTYADEVAKAAGLPAEIVRFALLGDPASAITTGAARNSLLIDTVGGLFLLVDDDSVCRVAPCPQHQPGLALDARTNPTELWFYRDRETMLEESQFAEQDPLALHEMILGRPIAECLPPANRAAELDLSYTTADLAQRLWMHPGRVLATSAGVLGDSGMGSTAYLALPPDSLGRLVSSEQNYHAAVVNRQILRAPLRTTISRGTFCVGASLGLDNRVLLPPFVPIQRNSDGLFARTLLRCFRDGFKGYLPWAVLHDPLPPRTQSLEGAEADGARIRLTHILRALIVPDAFTQSGDPGRDLRRLGGELAEIASQPAADFQHTIKARVVKSAALYLDGIERAAKTSAGPEFYSRRQQAHAEQLRRAITTEEYFIPRDLAGGSAEEVRRAAQRAVLQFGQVLAGWPAIVDAAKKLRSRGVRLSRAI